MIKQIYCSKFKQPSILFKNGLNVILGDEDGANSIGKSTTLLVIDYVLGGEDYQKSNDIATNVQNHEVGVCFEFKGITYYFVRDTQFTDTVFKADETFNKLEEQMTLDSYRNFLKDMYQLNMYDCSLRTTIGLFMRIYGKDNDNEEKPLHEVQKSNDEECIIRLVKILNYYQEIDELKRNYQELTKRNDVYGKAMNLNLIDAPKNQTEAKKIKKRIESIKQEIEVLSVELASQSISLNNEQMQILFNIKEDLHVIQNLKNNSYSKIQRYQYNLDSSRKKTVIDLGLVKKFFPNANILEINKINQFHKNISEIVSSDLKSQIKEETERYQNLEAKEKALLDSINPIIEENSPAKLAVQNMANLQRELFMLMDCINKYEKKASCKKEKSNAECLYNNSFQLVLTRIQQEINNGLCECCKNIYGQNKKAPLITLQPKRYIFETPNDTGTGSQFSGLVMFDLVMLSLSLLPVICHDSFILKNIEDQAIERILELYTGFSKKQIFISFDKQTSYSKKTAKILNDNCVLKLSPNGNELYGRSWSRS